MERRSPSMSDCDPIRVKPPALNSRPNWFSVGKCWKWQALHAMPVWRAKAGTAVASREAYRETATRKIKVTAKINFRIRPLFLVKFLRLK